MADLSDIQAAQTIKIVGSDPVGIETVPVGSSANGELKTDDCVNVSAVDVVIALTTTPVELKVGAGRLAERKYIWMEGQSNNIKWGFSNTTQSFDLFKNQLFCFPVGNVAIWARVTSGTGSVSFGEGA